MALDIQAQLGAVARVVQDRERDGKLAKVVQLSQTFPTSGADLWDAVTNLERIPRWFAPVSGDLQLNGKYAIEGNASGTITRCEEPRLFDATWEFGGGVSWIEVRFEEISESESRLELSHIAYPEEHWDMFGPGAVGIGWDLSFLGLFLYLTTGSNKPPEDGEWETSPEAVDFMTGSGNGWIEADLANGTDPETANRTGQSTIGFYTGANQPTE